MEEVTLNVEARDGRGKGASRQLRQAGKLPGIFYGPRTVPLPLAVDRKQFAEQVERLEGSQVIRFRSPAPELAQRVALVREVQKHPVTGEILHADFYEIDLTQRLRVAVPLHFVGKAIGVAEGGILQPILREIEVECLPTDIPGYVDVDVTALGIRDAIHIADLQMPANVTAVFESNDALVTVLAPTVEEVKVAAAEEGAPAEGAAAVEAPAKEAKEPGKGS